MLKYNQEFTLSTYKPQVVEARIWVWAGPRSGLLLDHRFGDCDQLAWNHRTLWSRMAATTRCEELTAENKRYVAEAAGRRRRGGNQTRQMLSEGLRFTEHGISRQILPNVTPI